MALTAGASCSRDAPVPNMWLPYRARCRARAAASNTAVAGVIVHRERGRDRQLTTRVPPGRGRRCALQLQLGLRRWVWVCISLRRRWVRVWVCSLQCLRQVDHAVVARVLSRGVLRPLRPGRPAAAVLGTVAPELATRRRLLEALRVPTPLAYAALIIGSHIRGRRVPHEHVHEHPRGWNAWSCNPTWVEKLAADV
eukprot:scaffold1849_cov66-Phaeocystis_antarctica.AAC.9